MMKFMLTARSGQAYACNWALLALCYEYSLGNIESQEAITNSTPYLGVNLKSLFNSKA